MPSLASSRASPSPADSPGPRLYYPEDAIFRDDPAARYWDDTRSFMEDRLVALQHERKRRARIDHLRHHQRSSHPHQPPPSPHLVAGGPCRLSDVSSSGGLRSWSDPSRSSCHVTRVGSSLSHLDLLQHPHHSRHHNYLPGGRTSSRPVPGRASGGGGAPGAAGLKETAPASGSPRTGSMSPLRQKRGGGKTSIVSGGDYPAGDLSIVEQRPPSGRTSERLGRTFNNISSSKSSSHSHEMMEKSSFTHTLDLIDGDCVREEGSVDYFGGGGGPTRPSQVARARFGDYGGPSHPRGDHSDRSNATTAPQPGSGIRHRGGRTNFFENEDDSPLLVSSIDGVSTQVVNTGRYGSGPSSLEEEDEDEGGGGLLLLRSGSQFSLLTPASSPFALTKSRGESGPFSAGGGGGRMTMDGGLGGGVSRLGSVNNLAMVTPYSSIRKRLKSVSMKYLKIMPKLNSSSSSNSSSSPARPSYPGSSSADSNIGSLGTSL